MKNIFACVLLFIFTSSAFAVQPDEVLKDASLEARARALSSELRCMVCQNQSIDESDAPLARDLRIMIREQLVDKKSDTEIKDFLVARYGEYVLLTPKFTPQTWFLWGTPFVILLCGLVFALRRKNQNTFAENPLSPEEKAKLAALETGSSS